MGVNIISMCNNQMGADEKSIQIRHMMTIFDKAETVVAWIGESTPQNQRAFSLMQTVAKGEESDARALLSSEQSAQLLSIELRRLYSSVWLTRTWVRQGSFLLFVEPASSTGTASEHQPLVSNPSCHYCQQIRQRNYLSGTMLANPKGRRLLSRPKVNLLEVLRDSSRFDVTDERDRLYGVIGMRIGQIMQTPANLFRLEFNKRLVELVDESTSESISIKEKYLTSEKTWCNALQTVPN